MTLPYIASNPLRWLGGKIDIRVEVEVLAEGGGVWDVGEWDTATWATFDWYDITRYVESIHISRGQPKWESRYAAGSCKLTLDNTSGLFNPEVEPHLDAVPWRPGRRLRVLAFPDPSSPSTFYPLFTGRIDDSGDSFDFGTRDIVNTTRALDALADLHAFNPLALETATGVQSTDARVHAALDRMGWPAEFRLVQEGKHTMQTSFLAQTTLEECQRAAEAEGGALFADAYNRVVFKNRDWLSRGATIPAGVIVGWADVDANIPEGWSRVSALDGRYLKQIPDNTTDPGTTGGSATHTHTTSGHTHSVNHSHTGGSTAAGSGATNTGSGIAGGRTPETHIHTLPTTGSATVSSQSASPSLGSASSEVSRKEYSFIESDGSPTEIPVGAIAIWADDSAPAGWQAEDSDGADTSRSPYMKGATGAGSKTFIEVTSHSHTIGSHTHSGTSHGHTSGNADDDAEAIAQGANISSGNTRANSIHQHPITVNNQATASLTSASGGTSGAANSIDHDPAFTRTLFVEKTVGGKAPVGLITIWTGSLDSIPSGWILCDGNNGTPDYCQGRFLRHKGSGTVGQTGGGGGHTHSGGSHTHSTSGHSHTLTVGAATSTSTLSSSGANPISSGSHTHTASTNSTTPPVGSASSGTSSSEDIEPPYIEVAYIMFVGEESRSTEIQGYLGYPTEQAEGVPHAPISAIRPSWDIYRIVNHATFARTGGPAYVAEDTDSKAVYGVRTYQRLDFQNNSDSEVEFLADRYIEARSGLPPRIRVDEVTIGANPDPDNEDLNRLFYDTQFGDLLAVKVDSEWGWSFECLGHVIGIEHNITPEDWEVTFTLDDALIPEEDES